jgi:bifunctional non-homologous end joining protein LigD
VERQDSVGPEAAARALAKAGTRRAPRGVAPSAGGGAARSVGRTAGGVAAREARPTAREEAPTVGPQGTVRPAIAPPTDRELEALDALPGRGGTWQMGAGEVALTNLDKVLAPGTGPEDPPITKRDLVRYYARIAPVMLPHLAGRALNLVRFPGGIDAASFWQKDIGRGVPDWVTRWREPDPPDRRSHSYVVADAIATLAWLGNQAAVEIHPWTSSIEAPAEPRWALVDIDPGSRTTWDETLVLARLYRQAFDHLGVTGIPKVSGKRGVQVFVPLRPGYTFEEARGWVEAVSRAVGGAVPDLVSWEWSKDRRDGRARLDFTQNWRNRTLVGPYSPRPAAGLPVSAPITWDELDDAQLRPDRWTIRTILGRVATMGDLFAEALGPGQELPRL